MDGTKILVTGATGQVALPVAEALAPDNEVWAIARFRDTTARQRLEAAGVRCVTVDLVAGDLTGLPDDFTYVLNFAVAKAGRWGADLDGNLSAVLGGQQGVGRDVDSGSFPQSPLDEVLDRLAALLVD